MNQDKMKQISWILVLSFLLSFLITGCKLELPGTETGNPDMVANPSPVNMIPANTKTAQLGQLICSRIHFCFPQADVSDCSAANLKNIHFGSEMNLPNTYTDLTSIINGEWNKKLIPWTTGFNECFADVNNIACDNVLMKSQWIINLPKEFPNAHWLLRASPYCQRLFD